MGAGHFQEFEDEYLETLYEFHERFPGKRVRNGDLAKYLDVSPASATEMVQRLAKNGFVDYVPYKGVNLTEKGLDHGMMMKRRHRLAEVLLTLLPFEGDIHETACRLEHAFDDDLEVCISLLLGNPTLDPSGRDIPPANSRIAGKIDSGTSFSNLSDMSVNSTAEIMLIMLTSESSEVLQSIGIEIGNSIQRLDDGFSYNGTHVKISDEIAKKVIVRRSE
ncbi:MAG: metal-dependent transcriptional regulator [Candidatus Poseidoniales archaeon]|nr:MAG: metal-dependent transcriptional regulator [Candidatus Poseidoniales archaeon]|tara:strand:- start:943 stop:1602 length:660 start_codon:yes stop_codon:yes gene_type:complete